jgi:SWI/SNF related-matrix-associated actin-dependent regulator of chromatin subfamily C
LSSNATPSTSSTTSDSRLKWRKRKRNPDASLSKPSTSAAVDGRSNESDYEDDETAATAPGGSAGSDDPALDLREAELLSSIVVVSAFPSAKCRVVNRPHPSILTLLDAERSGYFGDGPATMVALALENITHG